MTTNDDDDDYDDDNSLLSQNFVPRNLSCNSSPCSSLRTTTGKTRFFCAFSTKIVVLHIDTNRRYPSIRPRAGKIIRPWLSITNMRQLPVRTVSVSMALSDLQGGRREVQFSVDLRMYAPNSA